MKTAQSSNLYRSVFWFGKCKHLAVFLLSSNPLLFSFGLLLEKGLIIHHRVVLNSTPEVAHISTLSPHLGVNHYA